jgi:hypothetical protein
VDGNIWLVKESGDCNYPADIEILGNTVRVLGPKDELGEGRLIEEEYELWPSLMSLAMAIEHSPGSSADGSISLAQAVASAHEQVCSFEKMWIKANSKSPSNYPMVLEANNAGIWFEQIVEHSIEASD